MSNKEFKRYTITSALPYANGPVHIGHLAGVYVPADIYARYLRLTGRDVVFVGGSDEHGVPITIKAKNEGVTPQQVVDKYHAMIDQSFRDFGISFDVYSRTSRPVHHETASEIFKRLHDQGEFVEKVSQQYYDEENNQFLADRYIIGICPHCSYEKAYGDQCEHCGTSLSPLDLKDPKSTLSGNPPVLKETKHWYLPLDQYEGWLRQWILEEHKEWKPNVYGQCKSWIDQGLQPRAVTRDLEWGVQVPLAEAEGKVLYVWFDAPIGYISATKEWAAETGKDWRLYWKDEETRLIHFIGKDNIVFHCIIFPAILKQEGSYILPDNVPANEFLNLEGDKISTSRNWAVWLHEYLEDFPGKQDVLRYTLTANAPETKDNDFTWKDFQARNNNELVAIFGNFINRAMVLTHKYYEGRVPAAGTLTGEDQAALEQIKVTKENIEKNLETFRFREALKAMMDLARVGNKYLADHEPWKLIKTDAARVNTIMNVSMQISAALSVVAAPFLPVTAAKLNSLLNTGPIGWERLEAGYKDLLTADTSICEPELCFEKIEDDVIQQQLDKLAASKRKNQTTSPVVADPGKPNVDFEDFTNIDLRVGSILAAERVPKTKKLLKLQIDTGMDQRTVVSGIAEYYTPEEVIGRQVSLIANLAPRVIKGIESKGMILMAEDADGRLVFVAPVAQVTNGAGIK